MRAGRATRQPRSGGHAAVIPTPTFERPRAKPVRLAGCRIERGRRVAAVSAPNAIVDSGRCEYPREPESVHKARDDIRKALAEWGFSSLIDDVVLCVSEAVTNSIQHACTPFRTVTVAAWHTGTTVRVDVIDGDRHRPKRTVPPEADADGRLTRGQLRDNGRGIFLISQLATRWGVASCPPGKRVWFEFGAEPSA
jgi:anti-sigma regulatory factor (Ser/Thr protein kinase)